METTSNCSAGATVAIVGLRTLDMSNLRATARPSLTDGRIAPQQQQRAPARQSRTRIRNLLKWDPAECALLGAQQGAKSARSSLFQKFVADKILVGGYACLPYEIPLPSIREVKSKPLQPWQTRFPFAGKCLIASVRKVSLRDVDEDLAQFKCTFRDCGKRLATNVNFVHHVWAHVVDQAPWKRYRDLVPRLQFLEPQDDEHTYRLLFKSGEHACPECLSKFGAAATMRDHLYRLHRCVPAVGGPRAQCHICERDVQAADAPLHAELHGQYDLPYACELCRWHSSSRLALLKHFQRAHNASTLLLCPFCATHFTSKRVHARGRRTFITAHSFVQHLLWHVSPESIKVKCKRCARAFAFNFDSELHKTMAEHKLCHVNKRLKTQSKDFSSLMSDTTSKQLAPVNLAPVPCPDCGIHVKTVESHFRESKRCPNQGCQYVTQCVVAQRQHQQLCPLSADLCKRIPFGRDSLHAESRLSAHRTRPALCCSRQCGFSTEHPAAMVAHLIRNCVGARAVNTRKRAFEHEPAQCTTAPDPKQVKLFTLHQNIASQQNDRCHKQPNSHTEKFAELARKYVGQKLDGAIQTDYKMGTDVQLVKLLCSRKASGDSTKQWASKLLRQA